MRRLFAFLALCALAIGCVEPDRMYLVTPTGTYPIDGHTPLPAPPEDPGYNDTIWRVTSMVDDENLAREAEKHGLHVVNVMWEDTGRAHGSALGPNISDLTLQVRHRIRGEFADALMPVLRYPNFTDKTGDVPANRFFVRVGNHEGAPLSTVPLTDVLSNIRKYASMPQSLAGRDRGLVNLLADRDTHFLVSAQAVFLPIPKFGKATFNPVLFNYQSAPGSPAVLTIVASREGTSITVIENRREDATFRGWGQELYFNDSGHRAELTAERRSDVAARIAARGGPRTEADRSALGKGADVLAIIQVPLVHQHRGVLGGIPPSSGGSGSYSYEFSDDPLVPFGPNDSTIRVRPGPVRSDMERAVLGHGPRLGPFIEGHNGPLVRDTKFPIRITVQFYKATSDGAVTDKDLELLARNIKSVYEHADFVGSLVVPEGDARRPTEWQHVPREWFPW